MEQRGLGILPDDVLLIILEHLESAQSVAHLAVSCRRFYLLMKDEGWRVFTRARFPSLPLPAGHGYGWDELAESTTWQSRCWDRKSLTFKALLPRPRPARHRPHVVPFQPALDAYLNPVTREELVVWGAGENIVARSRRRAADGKPSQAEWYRADGKCAGYVVGYDDVKALCVVRDVGGYPGKLGILAGRDNGDLSLLSADAAAFGEQMATFSPLDEVDGADGAVPAQPAQDTINSLDVLYPQNLVAATAKSSVFLYKIPNDDDPDIAPSAVYDVGEHVSGPQGVTLCRAKWMAEGSMLALGLRGCKDPLRYIDVTPDGFTISAATRNEALEDKLGLGQTLCPTSIEPVNMSSLTTGRQFLLSAWRDGTCRLQDIRTPSPFDAVYCDNVDPWAGMETLMPYGTERFVGGGMHGATVKVFDFRWPKGYYHTAGLPCSGLHPFPQPHQPFLAPPREPSPALPCCDHLSGYRCRWHGLSRDIYYRPNASFFLSKALPPADKHAGVWSLARASSVSPNFYVGISGGIVEASLQPNGSRAVDPNFGFRDAPTQPQDRCGYVTMDLGASMMETGDGLAYAQNDRNIRIPPMHGGQQRRPSFEWRSGVDQTLRKRHRLDSRFQAEEDFRNLA